MSAYAVLASDASPDALVRAPMTSADDYDCQPAHAAFRYEDWHVADPALASRHAHECRARAQRDAERRARAVAAGYRYADEVPGALPGVCEPDPTDALPFTASPPDGDPDHAGTIRRRSIIPLVAAEYMQESFFDVATDAATGAPPEVVDAARNLVSRRDLLSEPRATSQKWCRAPRLGRARHAQADRRTA